jgi:hypothetical protein
MGHIWFIPGANEVPRLQMSVKQACLDPHTAQQSKTRPDWFAIHRCRRGSLAKSPTQSGGLAYKVADFTTLFEEAGQASVEPVTGSHLWVLRESLPEHWQVAVVAWSTAEHTNAA